MPEIHIDLHILKKVIANNSRIEANTKKMAVLFMEIQELYGENRALLQFIENICNEEENKR